VVALLAEDGNLAGAHLRPRKLVLKTNNIEVSLDTLAVCRDVGRLSCNMLRARLAGHRLVDRAPKQLGHSTPSLVMNTYGHVTERMQTEATATLDRVLGG